jgi:UDP-N-acetyl-D-mannosaminuronate dehydrogenase
MKRVGVLGLSYKGDLKVSILSPTIPFVETLVKNNIKVKIYDPYFSDQEVNDILKVKTFRFPDGLKEFDAVVLAVDHKEYMLSGKRLAGALDRCRFVLDNTGFWSRHKDAFTKKGIEYHLAGDANWL